MAEEQKQKLLFKQVAVVRGRFFSIYDGKTEFILGETLHQDALPDHCGGFYVYRTAEEALFADIQMHKGGLFIAPRTVLKVMAWGDCVEYPNGKLSFSYICPVLDIGLPQGYLTTKTAKRYALKLSPAEVRRQHLMSLPYWDSLPQETGKINRRAPPKRMASVRADSSMADLRKPQSRPSAKTNQKKLHSSLVSMREETRRLELELVEMERRATGRRLNPTYVAS